MTVQDRAIHEVIAPVVEDMGFDLVRVSLGGAPGRGAPALQVLAERPDGTMTIDDCAKLSRALSVVLEEADPIRGAYMLEVSSPGIDRPLVKLADFERFKGELARIELGEARDGQRRFKGWIIGVRGDEVELDVDGEQVSFPHDGIIKAKLVLTDELAAAGLAKGGRSRR